MSVITIIFVFVAFCVIQLFFQIAWKLIEGKMTIRLMDKKLDAAYAKGVRLILKGISEVKDLKGVFVRD